MSCGVGHEYSSDPALLWLWNRPAARALIQPLAWELPYAMGTALKRQRESFPKIIACAKASVQIQGCMLSQPAFPLQSKILHLWEFPGGSAG